jgi:hypothetical protein
MTAHDDVLSERECWELLPAASVGWLALSIRSLPVILPIQYYLDGRWLAVCLGHHALPERALDETIVAFAADSIDPVTRSGWSVHVQGRSVIPRGLRVDTDCGWPAASAQVVQIEPGIISGHRMRLCPFIDTLLAADPKAVGHLRAASAGYPAVSASRFPLPRAAPRRDR